MASLLCAGVAVSASHSPVSPSLDRAGHFLQKQQQQQQCAHQPQLQQLYPSRKREAPAPGSGADVVLGFPEVLRVFRPFPGLSRGFSDALQDVQLGSGALLGSWC